MCELPTISILGVRICPVDSHMNDAIILFTPTHTGTHFARMLLESHSEISTAIGEDYWIDADFRPNYTLAGRGMGWHDPTIRSGRDRGSERMLREYILDFIEGRIEKSRFVAALGYWQTISSERKLPLRNREHHLAQVANEFAEVGVRLSPKREQYLLYRAHCHRVDATRHLARLTKNFPVVVTVRHPLRAILTIMRREPREHHAGLIEDLLIALRVVLNMTSAYRVCVDLRPDEPERLADVFRFLGLSVEEQTRRFLAARPCINKTVAPGEKAATHNVCLEAAHASDFARTLSEARDALDRREMHPILRPHWKRAGELGLPPLLEESGYVF